MLGTSAGFNGTSVTGGIRMETPRSESQAEDILTGPPLTNGYKPSIPAAFFQATRGQAFLPSMLADVEGMLLHPVVITPYEYYKSAIQSVKFRVRASSSEVGSFVLTEIQKFWGRCLAKVQEGYDYGWVGGELSYKYEKGKLGLHTLDTFHPLDSWALTRDHDYVGVSVINVPDRKERVTLWAAEDYPAKAFWFSHNRRWDRYYGRSQLYGAWRPWRRLAHRDGAEEVIDAGVYRFAYRGPIMRYPVKAFAKPDGSVDYDGARNKAREFVENAKAGVGVALPNSRDEKGEYEWVIDWPDHTINVSSLVEYAKYLEGQVSLGVGVPLELLQASDTGSGWSGRKVPMLGFYQGQKKNANAVTNAWKGQVGDPLVAWNYGPEAWFEIGAELMLPGGLSDDQQQPGAGGQPPPPPGGGGNPLAGLMGGDSDGGEGGEMSTLADEGETVNHRLVAALQAQGRGKKKRQRRIELGRPMEPKTVARNPQVELGPRQGATYVKSKSRTGRLIGVNPQDASDRIYGAEAEEYFRRQDQAKRTRAKPQPAKKGPGAQESGRKAPADDLDTDVVPTTPEGKEQAVRGQERGQARSAEKGEALEAFDRKGPVDDEARQSWISKTMGRVSAFFKNMKESREGKKAKAEEESWEKYENALRKATPEQRVVIKTAATIGDALLDYMPGTFLKRMRGEAREQAKQAREKAQTGVSEEEREERTTSILELLDSGLEAIQDTLLSAIEQIDPTGVAAPLLGSFATGPILSVVYLAASTAMNPMGTLRAAWGALTRSTAADKERAAKRKTRSGKADRFAELPGDHPEVKERSVSYTDDRARKKAHKAAANTSLGFELGGKVYPAMRHRIREIFANAKDADWAEALFIAALDLHRDDPAEAIDAVEEALKKNPRKVAGEGVDFLERFNLDDVEMPEGEEAELSTLVDDSVWVLTMPELCGDDELRDLQARLRGQSPEALEKVRRRVREQVG